MKICKNKKSSTFEQCIPVVINTKWNAFDHIFCVSISLCVSNTAGMYCSNIKIINNSQGCNHSSCVWPYILRIHFTLFKEASFSNAFPVLSQVITMRLTDIFACIPVSWQIHFSTALFFKCTFYETRFILGFSPRTAVPFMHCTCFSRSPRCWQIAFVM
jgi:hypothetical protein